MAKLYFKYGAMGSSKTAQALITKFNYEERGMRVWLIKPATDNRDGDNIIKSRVGLESECRAIDKGEDILALYECESESANVVIADECQFFTPEQIDMLRELANERNVPVLCFGLRTDFMTKLFPGSRRLFEIADEITEIKTMCECGKKATVTARIDKNGGIITEGRQVFLGGNDRYVAMCHKCWRDKIKEKSEVTK